MRITNKIMQRNNLANINTNKVYQDELSTQMSTQKKIARASDDPVVAIRALRLRSNVTEVTQYYSKNIPDAKSWLEITEDALKNQSQVMTDMIAQATKGANGDLSSTDRGIILEQLQALGKEVYSTANADYAGRYVFTGFRTDTPLSFISSMEKTYEIKEQLDRNAISTLTKVESGNILDWTSENYDSLTNADEQSVEAVEVYRLQLAYKECSETVSPAIRYRDSAGDLQKLEATIMHSYESDPSPYKAASQDADAVIYVPETGEILLGANHYQELMKVKDDVTTSADEGQIQVIYQKDSWLAGDLRPEHYFYCKSDPGTADEIEYNNSLKNGSNEQYNKLVSDRDDLRKAVDAIQEKYPDVPIVTVNEDPEQLAVDPDYMYDLNSQVQDKLDGIAALETEKSDLASEQEALEAERDSLTAEQDTATDERKAEIATRLGEISTRLDEITARNPEIDEELADLNEELVPLREEQDDWNSFNADWETIKKLTDEITFMDGDYENQAIEYDVGFNQTIRVNSTAGECFQHGIGRTVDDLVISLQEVADLEDMKAKIKKALDAAPEDSDEAKTLRTQYEAADKALTLAKDKNQKLFEKGITAFQKYLDDASLSITNCGNRSKKLELIENRMQSQKTTFETLKSENEDVDIAETAIQLTSAQLTYEAALMATGKVSQNSLLQYI